MNEHDNPFAGYDIDQQRAATMLNKHLLVAISYLNSDDSIRAVEQYHGPILRINNKEGLVFMRMDNGKEMSLPPDLDAYEVAEEGEYGLKSTGEVISNPDLIAAWSIYPDEA